MYQCSRHHGAYVTGNHTPTTRSVKPDSRITQRTRKFLTVYDAFYRHSYGDDRGRRPMSYCAFARFHLRNLQAPAAVQLEVLGFSDYLSVKCREDEVVVDQAIERGYIAAELRLSELELQRQDDLIEFFQFDSPTAAMLPKRSESAAWVMTVAPGSDRSTSLCPISISDPALHDLSAFLAGQSNIFPDLRNLKDVDTVLEPRNGIGETNSWPASLGRVAHADSQNTSSGIDPINWLWTRKYSCGTYFYICRTSLGRFRWPMLRSSRHDACSR